MKRGRLQAHVFRGRPLADHDVEREIFHRRVEDFLDGAPQAMNFVDEQHVAQLHVRQNRGEIAGALNRRTRRDVDVGVHLVGDDVRQRRFAQAGRAVKQDVIDWLFAPLRRLDDDLELLAHAVLPDQFSQQFRAQGDIFAFVPAGLAAHQTPVIVGHGMLQNRINVL